MRHALIAFAAVAALTLAARADEPGLRDLKGNDAVVEPLAGYVRGVRVVFQPAEWPNARVDAPAGSAWDWRETGLLVARIRNPGDQPVDFGVRIDDDPAADGVKHCRAAMGVLAPGVTETFAIAMDSRGPMALGMRGLPGSRAERNLAATGDESFDLGHVVAAQIFLHAPRAPTTLEILSADLTAVRPVAGIVDAFGQYAGDDWPGKVHSEADLKVKHEAELAALAGRPAPEGRDKYGGWKAGPREKPTGFFHATKRDGKWWLVDPEGALFVSLGADCVTTHDHNTIVTDREGLFTWLPEKDDPLSKFYGSFSNVHSGPVKRGESFSFYRANLSRLYGAEMDRRWADATLDRLASWGFNTIGNWSDRSVARLGRMPYVATLGIRGDFAEIASGDDYWGEMRDPFDPRFAAAVARSVSRGVAETRDDPWCLGYFVDNELSWGGGGDRGRIGLALGTLAMAAADSPAKREFVARLKKRHEDVGRLNDAWRTSLKDWNALDAPWRPEGDARAWSMTFHDDCRDFVREIARAYFRTIRDELRKADPNHMYLGCRFAWKTDEAVEAAGEFCDVVSFNVYKRAVDPREWAVLSRIDRPAIIGEFHFGALDRGMFHAGLAPTGNQRERADAYEKYVQSVLEHPSFVGCHWFQYVDEPITGRTYDGENYNIGLVSVADLAYPELTAAARRVHADAYMIRHARPRTR